MKASEIRELTIEEMNNKLNEIDEKLFNLRFQKATSQLENPKAISKLKKDYARIKTIITERVKGE